MVINRVRPLSVGKIAAFIYGLIGLFIGVVIASSRCSAAW